MKKICKTLIIGMIVFFAICSNNFVKADQGDYGRVSNLSTDSEVTITGEGTGDVKLKYNRLKLAWYKADLSIGRPVDRILVRI